MDYIVLNQGVIGRNLVPADTDLSEYIGHHKDWYTSTSIYNDKHYDHWQKHKNLAGIEDVVKTRLIWDFDSSADVDKARKDAIELCNRLLSVGIKESALQICFSGAKGYHVEINLDEKITHKHFKNINLYFADGLETNDAAILDAARIIRLMGTRHPKSKLYKFPLSLSQLKELGSNTIKELAKDINNFTTDLSYSVIKLPVALKELSAPQGEEQEAPVALVKELVDLDFRLKPKGFSNCKFTLMNGFFPEGVRSHALMILGATCRAQGFPKDITYNILKGAARMQASRYGNDLFSKKDIWNTIVEQIYGPNWKGAQYTCKTDEQLKKICHSLGPNKCRHDQVEAGFLGVGEMAKQFAEFSDNIEKNTIKTGLASLDDQLQLTIGMPVALLGAPGSGKTSLALNILNNTSKMGINSAFFSMDMYGPLVFMKQVQKLEGITSRQVHELKRTDVARYKAIEAKVQEEYSRVKFSLKSGHTVQDMRDIITEHQDATGEKVQLVLIDYLECIAGPYSDATANSAKIAGELKDFATEMGTCVITLVQPPKSAGDASSALTSMRQIKGSSMLEQSFRAIVGIYREGFGPQSAERDRYLTLNVLKNTMGPLFSIDYAWDGVRGEIYPLDEESEKDLDQLRKDKARKKEEDGNW